MVGLSGIAVPLVLLWVVMHYRAIEKDSDAFGSNICLSALPGTGSVWICGFFHYYELGSNYPEMAMGTAFCHLLRLAQGFVC
jgi:hypothetical protein